MINIEFEDLLNPEIINFKSININGKKILDYRGCSNLDNKNLLIYSLQMPKVDYFLSMLNKDRPIYNIKFQNKNKNKIKKNWTKLYNKKQYGHEMLSHITKILKDDNKIILDLCSGDGENEQLFYELGAKKVILTDYRSNNAHILTDVHNLPFKDNSFDIVFCSQAIEHWYNPYQAFNQINRILKKFYVKY